MPKGIIGRKVGMTQVFDAEGNLIPVTVVKVGPCKVIRKKSATGKDGYNAIVVGFDEVRSVEIDGEKKYRLNQPELGVFKAAGFDEPMKVLREFRLWDQDLDKYEVGQELNTEAFVPGEVVDVTATSKGKGFSGVMKRHNFAGSKASHGVHEYFRHGGSIGTTTTPGRVFKGKKMPGQHGNTKTTVQNLVIYEIDRENNLFLLRGSVPGPNGGLVVVQDAAKRRRRPRAVKA